MFWNKKEVERDVLLRCRIKELENILCPGEQHDFKEVSRTTHYGNRDLTYTVRYVCQRCLKAKEESEF